MPRVQAPLNFVEADGRVELIRHARYSDFNGNVILDRYRRDTVLERLMPNVTDEAWDKELLAFLKVHPKEWDELNDGLRNLLSPAYGRAVVGEDFASSYIPEVVIERFFNVLHRYVNSHAVENTRLECKDNHGVMCMKFDCNTTWWERDMDTHFETLNNYLEEWDVTLTDFLNARTILWPIKIEESQTYALGVINPIDKKHATLDSMGKLEQDYHWCRFGQEIVEMASSEVKRSSPFDPSEYKIERSSSALHNDYEDSGVFVCMNALAYILEKDPERLHPLNVVRARKLIALAIIRDTLDAPDCIFI